LLVVNDVHRHRLLLAPCGRHVGPMRGRSLRLLGQASCCRQCIFLKPLRLPTLGEPCDCRISLLFPVGLNGILPNQMVRRTPHRDWPRCNTSVYIMVVLISLCPRNSCTMRISYPASNRCVANERRNERQLAGFEIPARRTAFFTARCRTGL